MQALLCWQAQPADDARGAAATGAHSETSVMIGDRMDTDIVSGTEAGMRTILVLTGVTSASRWIASPIAPAASSAPSPTSNPSAYSLKSVEDVVRR